MDMNLNIHAQIPQMESSAVDTPLSLEAEPKNRCGVCRKKLKLTDLACRCSARFCSQHRPPEEHSCTYDFKAAGRAHLSKQLEKAVADKVERI
jgi:predicted nucleic acid binding AN1-type Zn finger protein